MTEGHGRAADIWSVSCVVLEMIKVETNKLSEFNFNLRIVLNRLRLIYNLLYFIWLVIRVDNGIFGNL